MNNELSLDATLLFVTSLDGVKRIHSKILDWPHCSWNDLRQTEVF